MSMIKDFIQGLSKTIIQELRDCVHSEISKCIDETVAKSTRRTFVVGIAISLIAIGFFLSLWGLASRVDKIFNMGGLGFVIFGIFGILTGLLVYVKFYEKLKT